MFSFFRRNRTSLGLDIGSGFVKAAVVDHSGPEPVLTHVGYLPLVSDAIVEGEIMDPPQVVETIRTLIKSMGITPRHVVTAVGGRDVIVKNIQMDRMAPEDAGEVIRWEAEQYVPFDMESVSLDFQILDPDADGLQMSVLLVAAKRELVDQKVSLIRDAGLQVGRVDVDAFALTNAFKYNYPEAAGGVVGLVNVGNEVSTILVMNNGVPVVSRDVPIGARHLREDLRRRHGLSAEEADEAIAGKSDRIEEFRDVFDERNEELSMGVERAMAFLAMDNSVGSGPREVYLSGGAARIPRLADAVAERLRVRVAVANPLQRLSVKPDVTVQFPADELASMLMLPIGLALRAAT